MVTREESVNPDHSHSSGTSSVTPSLISCEKSSLSSCERCVNGGKATPDNNHCLCSRVSKEEI